jgi:HEAT repeat protein
VLQLAPPTRVGSHPGTVLLLLLTALLAGCRPKPPYAGKSEAQLEKMLHDPKPQVQAQGAFGLSRLGPDAQAAVPALIERLKGEAPVRQNAAVALGEIGPAAKDAVPALIETLRDPEWTVRRQAAVALGRIGPDAKAALPALERLRRDRDNLVRKAAEEAVGRIRANANPGVTGRGGSR